MSLIGREFYESALRMLARTEYASETRVAAERDELFTPDDLDGLDEWDELTERPVP